MWAWYWWLYGFSFFSVSFPCLIIKDHITYFFVGGEGEGGPGAMVFISTLHFYISAFFLFDFFPIIYGKRLVVKSLVVLFCVSCVHDLFLLFLFFCFKWFDSHFIFGSIPDLQVFLYFPGATGAGGRLVDLF